MAQMYPGKVICGAVPGPWHTNCWEQAHFPVRMFVLLRANFMLTWIQRSRPGMIKDKGGLSHMDILNPAGPEEAQEKLLMMRSCLRKLGVPRDSLHGKARACQPGWIRCPRGTSQALLPLLPCPRGCRPHPYRAYRQGQSTFGGCAPYTLSKRRESNNIANLPKLGLHTTGLAPCAPAV